MLSVVIIIEEGRLLGWVIRIDFGGIVVIILVLLRFSLGDGLTKRFELFYLLNGKRGDTFTFGLVALNGNERIHINFKWIAEVLVATIGHLQTRIYLIGEQDKARVGVVAQEI